MHEIIVYLYVYRFSSHPQKHKKKLTNASETVVQNHWLLAVLIKDLLKQDEKINLI